MATLKEIRKRIISVKNTQQITKAMKMVSASKLRKAHNEAEQARPYSDRMKNMISRINFDGIDEKSALLEKKEKGTAVVLLITSDKGLCGGLNANLCRKILLFQRENEDLFDKLEFVVVGKKGRDYLRARGFEIRESYTDLRDYEQKKMIVELTVNLINEYAQGKFSNVFLAYNCFFSIINQEPRVISLLPLVPGDDDANPDSKIMEYEPKNMALLDAIIKKYLQNQSFTALLDNHASEHGSRMAAMDSASKNASEMIAKLQLKYNRARQAAITTELTEIISGAESIN